MDSNKSVTANFSPVNPQQYYLTTAVNPPGAGTVAAWPEGPGYNSGAAVTLTATAATGYQFTGFSGVDSSNGSQGYVTMNANRSVTANFTQQSYVQVTLAEPTLYGSLASDARQLTFHFTHPMGSTNIAGGQILINTQIDGPDANPACQIDWNAAGDLNISGNAWGAFGGSTLSTTNCTLYAGSSTLTQTASGYDVSIFLSFASQFPNVLAPIWARGTAISGATSEYDAMGAWILASPLDRTITAVVPVIDDPLYCGGDMLFGIDLNRYSNGSMAGALTAVMGDTGNSTGWWNTASNGRVFNYSTGSLIAANFGSATSSDFAQAHLPIGPSGPNNPAGKYAVVGDFTYSNPNCIIVLEQGSPGYTSADGHTAYFPNLYYLFNFSSSQGDPSPWIETISLSQPLVAGGSALATIDGSSFGTVPGSLSVCASGDDPCDSTFKVSVSVTSWTPSRITASITASAEAAGPYDVQVTSAGATGQFAPGAQQASPKSNRGQVQVEDTICDDERDLIISEYRTYFSRVQFMPQCSWFTQYARSEFFSFAELSVNSSYTWALVKRPLTVARSASYGLDRWRELLGVPQTVNSAYRSPVHNFVQAKATSNRGRHMHGDAIDIRNVSRTKEEHAEKACKAGVTAAQRYANIYCSAGQSDAGADYVEPLNGPCGYGCVHADWRNHDERPPQYSRGEYETLQRPESQL